MKSFLPTLTLGAILLVLLGCSPASSQQDEAAPPAPPPVAVSTLVVQPEKIPLQYEYVGQIAGSLEVEIRNRITGIIEQRHFEEGGDVTAGQLLFSLDDAQYRAQLRQAQAAIDSARAQKLTAEAQLKKARRELKRVTPLADQQMLSQNQQDDAASAVDIAVAQVAVADAAINQAEANLLTAQINLEYTRIRAPVAGVVGRAQQNRGALVQDLNNSLLTTLVQVDPVHVNFGVPENDWVSIRGALNRGEIMLEESGFRVELLDAANQPTGKTGALNFQDYKVDAETGSVAMRADIDNADRALSPGQFVRVRLNGAYQSDAIAVPQRAVLDGPGGKYVYVVSAAEQGTVAMQKPVVPGQWVDIDDQRRNFWVIENGLVAGDEVIIDGMARIFFPGMAVQTEPAATRDAPPAAADQG